MVEKDINKRWEQGIPHHPYSEAAIQGMADVDFKYAGDSLCIKYGGDGDNGEHMMYLLDIYFECLEAGEEI